MTWFQDLSECTYWDRGGELFSKWLLAVGWLERDHHFERGTTACSVLDRLCELLIDPWEDYHQRFRGSHTCTLCPPSAFPGHGFNSFRHKVGDKWKYLRVGANNLFIPGQGFLYVAPSLIVHYIAVHEYLPPPEFCQALLDCPPMRSDAYFEAVVKNGPPDWTVQAIEDAEGERWIKETLGQETRPTRLLIVDSYEETHSWFQQLAMKRKDIEIASQIRSVDQVHSEGQPINVDIVFIDLELAVGEVSSTLRHWKTDSSQHYYLHHHCTEESNGHIKREGQMGLVESYYCWPLSDDELEMLLQKTRHYQAYWSWLNQRRKNQRQVAP